MPRQDGQSVVLCFGFMIYEMLSSYPISYGNKPCYYDVLKPRDYQRILVIRPRFYNITDLTPKVTAILRDRFVCLTYGLIRAFQKKGLRIGVCAY